MHKGWLADVTTRIEFNELGLVDLAQIPSEGSYWSIRRADAIRAVWTRVPALDTWLLNLFSSRGAVFWSLGMFAAFKSSYRKLHLEAHKRPDFRSKLEATIDSAGADRQSIFSCVLLSALTSQFSDRYKPVDLGDEYFRFAQRHFSIAVPNQFRDRLACYFSDQCKQFGDDAIRAVDESTELVSDSSFNSDEYYALLGEPLGRLTRQRVAQLAGEANFLGAVAPTWVAGRDVSILYGFPGEISLALLAKPAVPLEDIAVLARFRAEVALRICALPIVERLHRDLSTRGWDFLPELQAELRAAVDRRLSAPVIAVDPFALSGHTEAAIKSMLRADC